MTRLRAWLTGSVIYSRVRVVSSINALIRWWHPRSFPVLFKMKETGTLRHVFHLSSAIRWLKTVSSSYIWMGRYNIIT